MFNRIKALIFSSIKLTFNIFICGIVQGLRWILLSYCANRLYKLGQYNQAILIAEQAVKLSQSFGKNHVFTAISLNNLGLFYNSQGQYSKAEHLYKQAIEIIQIALPKNHPLLAVNFNNLSGLYYSQGKYSEAELLLKQAIEIDEIVFPENHPQRARELNNLAELYRCQGKYPEAENLYKQVIEIDKIALPNNHPESASHLNNLAALYSCQSRYSEAEPLYKKAIEIHKISLPENHPESANFLTNLGGLYKSQGRYSEAENLYKQAMKIDEITLPENHPQYAREINNLADLYTSQGRYSEAEPLYKKAIKINTICLPKSNPEIASYFHNLATLYSFQGRYLEAEHWYKQAIEIDKIALPKNHPNLATDFYKLGLLLAQTDRPKEAFKLMLKASKIQDHTIQVIFASSSESDRLAYIQEKVRPNLEGFLSLVYQYFPHSQAAKQAALNLVLKRKALTATALAAQNQAVFSGRYPQLQEIFQKWRQKCDQLLAFTYQVPPPEKREAHKQQLAQLQKECNELERQLAREVPEIAMQEQMGDRRAVALELPEGAKLLEFVRFSVCDFKAEKENRWQEARYVAFVLAARKPNEIEMIDLGEAEHIDRLISVYRESVMELPKDSGEPPAESGISKMGSTLDMYDETPTLYQYDSQPGKQLREAVFDKLRDKLAGCSHLVLAPDGNLNLVPFQILPEDNETTILQDEYSISYVSVGRELLRRRIKTGRTANQPLILADPNFDWPQNDTSIAQPDRQQEENMAVSGMGVSNVSKMLGTLAGKPFPRVKATADFAKTIGQQLGVQPFLQNEAIADRLLKCQSPKLLVVATHGYNPNRLEEYMRLLIELLKRSQEKEAKILKENHGLVDEEFLAFIEGVRNSEDINSGVGERLEAIASVVKQQLKTTPLKPAAKNFESEIFQQNRHHAKVENPMMRSAVAFTGANTWLLGGELPEEFQTMVFAQDVAGVDLWETEVAILIACQSGMGDVQTGEGVFGLRRAFAVAGSKCLIMSLWSVPTLATMLLMERFLDSLRAGFGRADALKNAQNYLINVTIEELQKSQLGKDILEDLGLEKSENIEMKPLDHPYFWGAWICQGEVLPCSVD